MKRLLILLLATMLATPLFAQKYEEIVYLKSGSEIHGTVIEQIPGFSVTVQTKDGSRLVYRIEEVERIAKIPIVKDKSSGLKAGYRCFVDEASTFGTEIQTEISTLHGYQLNKHWFIGGGVGLHFHAYEDALYVPIFAALRYDMLNRRATPFIEFRGGYAVGENCGYYLSPTVGVRIRLGDWGGLNIGLGLTAQEINYNDNADDPKDTLGGLTLRVGFEF